MKKILLLVVLLSLLANLNQAQVKFRVKKLNADSLVNLIPEKDGTEKIEALNVLSNVICRQNTDSSLLLATQAIERSEKLEYQKGLADGYLNTGNVYFLLDSLQPTISNYLKALRIYEDLEPSEEYGNLCVQLALTNYFTGRYEVSTKYILQALGIYNKIDDKTGKWIANFAIASGKHVIYLEYDSAIYYCNEALKYLDPEKNPTEVAFIFNEIGWLNLRKSIVLGDASYLSKAHSWQFKAIALPGIADEAKAWVYLGIATVYRSYDSDESKLSAIDYCQKVNQIGNRCFDVYDLKSHAYEILGWTYYSLGNYDMAILNFKQGIQFIDERLADYSINDFKEPIHAYNWKYYHKVIKQAFFEALYTIYAELGDYEEALKNFEFSKKAEKEIYEEKNQKLVTMLESISEDEKTERQLVMLARENEVKALTIRQSRMYLFALIGFILILVLLTIFYIRQRKTRGLLREQQLLHDLELKNMESEKLKELDQLKSRFFANISHEFRTPLTLIKGPLEKLLPKTEDPEDIKELALAKKYTGKLQILINNLLSISKLESGKMKLYAAEVDAVKMVGTYIQSFESLAKQKNITLTFIPEKEKINAYIDREKFEQVLNNLLSNAFKFTDDGERIEVAVRCRHFKVGSKHWSVGKKRDSQIANCQLPAANLDGQCVQIIISDTGRGIALEHLSHIFDRFYQAGQEDNSYYEGTGIGLALTKELVELHHGEIKVESEPAKGSTFTLVLPLGKDHLNPDEIVLSQPSIVNVANPDSDLSQKHQTSSIQHQESSIQHPTSSIQHPTSNTEHRIPNSQHPTSSAEQPILLIVEDNPDMRAYIRGYFERDFNTIEAIDGMDGYEKSVEHIPDIIISDVMMPTMDGNELCNKIKTDERTSHIPVILITARASKESRIEGLETGADDFVTKPFDGDELQVRVKNLIQQRHRLNLRMEAEIRKSQNVNNITFKDSSITSMDEQFLKKLMQNLNDHFADPEFNAGALSLKIGLSRAQLHRKVKALIGQSTGDLIRSFRLIRAAELIKAESATIAEIAYDVGFSSPSYFSECFRKQFGKLPSEFNG